MRKICRHTDRQGTSNQTNGSNTEATLILCGYSGERANNRGDHTIKEEVRRRKIRKFASRHTSKEQSDNQTKNSNTEATLILCGYSGERANNRGDSTTERRMRRRKMRKFAYNQTSNQRTIRQTDGSNTEATLI